MKAQQALQILRKQRRWVIAAYAAVLLLAAGTVVLLLWRREGAAVSLAVLVAFYVLVVSRLDRHYGELFVQLNLLVTASGVQNARVLKQGSIPREVLNKAGLFPLPPGKEGALVKSGIQGDSVSAAEIATFYQVPADISKHGVLLMKGLLYSLETTACSKERVCMDRNIIPESVADAFYSSRGLKKVRMHAGENDRTIYACSEMTQEELDAAEKHIRAVLLPITEKGGKAIFSMHGKEVYLFYYRKTLEMPIPVMSAPPLPALESDRIPELRVLLREFGPCAGEKTA